MILYALITLAVMTTASIPSRAATGPLANCEAIFGDEIKGHEHLVDFFSGRQTAKKKYLAEAIAATENKARKAASYHDQIKAGLQEDSAKRSGFFWFLYTPLTEGEVAERLAAMRAADKTIKDLEVEIKNLVTKMNQINQELLKEALLVPSFKTHLLEKLKLLRIESMKSRNVVSLLFGNSKSELDGETVGELTSLVKALLELRYQIVFDADSNAAPLIAELAGKSAIGVSLGEPAQELASPVVTFENPYHKFIALRHARAIIADATSVAGIAYHLTGDLDFVLDPSGFWPQGLQEWEKQLDADGLNVGLKIPKVNVLKSSSAILGWKYKEKDKDEYKPVFSPQEKGEIPGLVRIEYLGKNALERLRQYVDLMAMRANKIKSLGGAAVFGSSVLHRKFAPWAYDLSYGLALMGVPVRTGGSMGLMLAANMGAHDAGGVSIGIPKLAPDLKSETGFPTHLHTHTVYTTDYAGRIALLLRSVDLLVALPGRDGTLREISVGLLRAAAGVSQAPIILFGQSFYQKFYDWLSSHPAASAFADRLAIANDVEDVKAVVQSIADIKLGEVGPPRTSRERFPNDLYKTEGP